jgi:diguanylate cyclase (GGDEF)-like protein
LHEFDNQQTHVEHVHVRLVHALLDILQRMIAEDSPLVIRLKLLQARLQPPLLLHDIDSLNTDFEQCLNDVVGVLGFPANRIVRVSPSEVIPGEEIVDEIVLMPNGSFQHGQHSSVHREASSEPRDASVVKKTNDVQGKNSQEISELRDTLSHQLRETAQQNQDFCVMLDLTMGEMQQAVSTQDIEVLKKQLFLQAGRLRNNSQKIVEVLERADQFLGNVEVDYKQLDEELNRARLLSLTDDLTELPNRRAFLSKLEDEVGRVRRHNQPLTLAIIDLDEFKSVNDQYGHAVGDEVLRCYADDVFSIFRQYDMVARFGGEEFAVLLPNTDKEGALCALNKVRAKVGQVYCEVNNKSIPIPSFSAGLAVYAEGESLGAYIERADQAMYRAKSLGRDRVEVDSDCEGED